MASLDIRARGPLVLLLFGAHAGMLTECHYLATLPEKQLHRARGYKDETRNDAKYAEYVPAPGRGREDRHKILLCATGWKRYRSYTFALKRAKLITIQVVVLNLAALASLVDCLFRRHRLPHSFPGRQLPCQFADDELTSQPPGVGEQAPGVSARRHREVLKVQQRRLTDVARIENTRGCHVTLGNPRL